MFLMVALYAIMVYTEAYSEQEPTIIEPASVYQTDYAEECEQQIEEYIVVDIEEPTSTLGLWYAADMQIPNITQASFYDIPLSEELQQYTWNICTYYEMQNYYELMLATMWSESNFDPSAISPTNDYGIMQINKSNHKRLKNLLGITDFLDAPQCITAGITMMHEIISAGYSDTHELLMCYNMGTTKASRKIRAGKTSSSYSKKVHKKLQELLDLAV